MPSTSPSPDNHHTPSPLTPSEARSSIDEYALIITQRLRPALSCATKDLSRARRNLLETDAISTALSSLSLSACAPPPEPDEAGRPGPRLETRVNIGLHFLVKAHVHALQPLIVDVGLGLLVEMSLAEVARFVEHRTKLYKQQVAACNKRIEHVHAHLKSLLECLASLDAAATDAQLFRDINKLYDQH